MNEFLKTRDQITQSTEWLLANGYVSHPISCKDWELKKVTERLTDGNILDMGADGSFVLHNAIRKKVIGDKIGIDLAVVSGDNIAEGAEYFQGDIMSTPFKDGQFDMLISCSVLEHQVDYSLFTKESARLLKKDGILIVSFDYWPQHIDTTGKLLYGLQWNILNADKAIKLISDCEANGLYLTSDVDWTVKDAVISDSYCSPFAGISYTFGIFQFIKQ